MRRQAPTLALLAALGFVSGCIGVRSGMVGHYAPPLATGPGAASIELDVTATIVYEDREEEANTATWGRWTDQLLGAYKASGMFSEVRRAPKTSDFRAEIAIVNTGKGRPLLVGLLCALTLNLIPSTSWEEYSTSTVFKDGTGATLGSYDKRERVRIWYQTFLILASPAAAVGTVTSRALQDLAFATLEDARRDGIFLQPR